MTTGYKRNIDFSNFLMKRNTDPNSHQDPYYVIKNRCLFTNTPLMDFHCNNNISPYNA